jgi:hypothetical protein
MTEQASQGEGAVAVDTITLVKVIGVMIPTVISAQDLRRRRREAALKKLTEEEIDALGLAGANFDERERQKQRA